MVWIGAGRCVGCASGANRSAGRQEVSRNGVRTRHRLDTCFRAGPASKGGDRDAADIANKYRLVCPAESTAGEAELHSWYSVIHSKDGRVGLQAICGGA